MLLDILQSNIFESNNVQFTNTLLHKLQQNTGNWKTNSLSTHKRNCHYYVMVPYKRRALCLIPQKVNQKENYATVNNL